jgi:uncharacterized membrane protein YozB (DUF420 family)
MSTIAVHAAPQGARSRERVFYTTMAFAMLGAVLLGFARSFYLHPLFPAHPVPPEPFFLIHGLAFTAWVLLVPVQTLLIANRRVDLHRAFGAAGAVLAVAMVALGLEGGAIAAARPTGFTGIPMPGWAFLIVPVAGIVQFGVFVALAIAKRRDAQSHKRWMLLATIATLAAAIARWPGVQETGNPILFFAINDLFLIPLIVHDRRTLGRLHPATLWGGLAIVLSEPLQLGLAMTSGWHAVANALIGALT